MSAWVKCSDRMPKPEDFDVLLWDGDEHWVGQWDGNSWWTAEGVCGDDFEGTRNFTHWMPLPEPPK